MRKYRGLVVTFAAVAYAVVIIVSDCYNMGSTLEFFSYLSGVAFVLGCTRLLHMPAENGIPMTIASSFGLATAVSGIILSLEVPLGAYQNYSVGFHSFYIALAGLSISLAVWRVRELQNGVN